jgi:hypothetical protein
VTLPTGSDQERTALRPFIDEWLVAEDEGMGIMLSSTTDRNLRRPVCR